MESQWRPLGHRAQDVRARCHPCAVITSDELRKHSKKLVLDPTTTEFLAQAERKWPAASGDDGPPSKPVVTGAPPWQEREPSGRTLVHSVRRRLHVPRDVSGVLDTGRA